MFSNDIVYINVYVIWKKMKYAYNNYQSIVNI